MLITPFVLKNLAIFLLTIIQIWTLPETQFMKWSDFKKLSKSSQVNAPPPMPKKNYSDATRFSYVYAIYIHRKKSTYLPILVHVI